MPEDSRRELLARSFDAIPERYDRGRLEYPETLVRVIAERLDLRPGRRVLDLAAGTGKLTRRLAETGADVVAVEPGDALRKRLRDALPDVQALAGEAEAIPLPDSSVDAVTVAAAFHWFRAGDALREIHRVLRTGGTIALVWNPMEPGDPIVAAVTELIDPLWGDARPSGARREWLPVVVRSGLFASVDELELEHSEEVDTEQLVDRVLSISAVAAAPPEVQQEVERVVRGLADERGGRTEIRTRPYAVFARRA